MSGWRDTDGRTAGERKAVNTKRDRAQFAADVRHRPLTLLKGLAGFALIVVLVLALIGWLR
jgi:hypothetical protein